MVVHVCTREHRLSVTVYSIYGICTCPTVAIDTIYSGRSRKGLGTRSKKVA